MILLALILSIVCAQTANAVQAVAVFELLPKSNVEEVTIDEVRHLTDELRKQATIVLPADGYSVLTRDNIIALIPPDEEEARCLAEGCAVDIGRAIGAEYVTQGIIGKFGKKLSISVELYETMAGKLLGSIVMESENVEGLLVAIRQEARPMFSKIASKPGQAAPAEAAAAAEKQEAAQAAASNAANDAASDAQKKSFKPSFWAGVALDAIGAGLIAYGLMKNSEIGSLQKDYNAYGAGSPQADIDATKKKMKDAESLRNIMYISGGAAIVSGIGVHIWF